MNNKKSAGHIYLFYRTAQNAITGYYWLLPALRPLQLP